MRRNRFAYIAVGGMVGLLLFGLGWGMGNYYLAVVGAVIIAASLATLTMPMPTFF